jgi:hypothetical protein
LFVVAKHAFNSLAALELYVQLSRGNWFWVWALWFGWMYLKKRKLISDFKKNVFSIIIPSCLILYKINIYIGLISIFNKEYFLSADWLAYFVKNHNPSFYLPDYCNWLNTLLNPLDLVINHKTFTLPDLHIERKRPFGLGLKCLRPQEL